MKTALFAVAADEPEKIDGKVVVGSGTRIVCECIDFRLAHNKTCNILGDPIVIAAAGLPAPEYGNVIMSRIMIDYIVSLGHVSRDQTVALCGHTFTIDGQARALAEYLEAHRDIRRLYVYVKRRHAPSALWNIKESLREAGITKIEIIVESCHSKPPTKFILREGGAIVYYRWKVTKERLRKALRSMFKKQLAAQL